MTGNADNETVHDIHVECDKVVNYLVSKYYGRALSQYEQCRYWFGHAKVDRLLLQKMARRAAKARHRRHHAVVSRLHDAAVSKLELSSEDMVKEVFTRFGALGRVQKQRRERGKSMLAEISG